MLHTSNLGFPRIGFHRELKKGLEKYWKAELTQQDLLEIAKTIRMTNWQLQHDLGIEVIPSNDFSFYDQILDTICMVGAVPSRYQVISKEFDLDVYFAMARGKQKDNVNIPAMEMTKWFNTNYHYIVPEIEPDSRFSFIYQKILADYLEAHKAGFQTRPVLIGPLTFLLLSKTTAPGFSPLEKLEELLPVYQSVLTELYKAGAEWIQIDEPILVKELSTQVKEAFQTAYQILCGIPNRPQLMLTSYFGSPGENTDLAFSLPVEGIHLDLVSEESSWDILDAIPLEGKILSLGIVNGHNIWRTDLEHVLEELKKHPSLSGDIYLAPSCSLIHVPLDINLEEHIAEPMKSWLSFAVQKLEEISALATVFNEGKKSSRFIKNQEALKSRSSFLSQHGSGIEQKAFLERNTERKHAFPKRKEVQQSLLNLPLFPTTTIGSFPQTKEIRRARSRFSKGELSREEYESFMKNEINNVIQIQEKIGLDVLVHGEFERNDMVQYFAEQLEGFIFTENGWVQSFGSRYVRPPILFGNVSRPHAMTTRWISYAQSLTSKPVKGMLTGPVTILQWSFVRDDQPRSLTCFQIADAINAEVLDLEKAGIHIIQIDEPALREGLPLKKDNWQAYLDWAVRAFHIAFAGVADETQIHTHMCYSEFNEIIASIAALDADVISIEAARSGMELLNVFSGFQYPNDIGPGIYDIHSPRIPSIAEMTALLEKAAQVIPPTQLWVNPDCGLKTRNWQEVTPALQNMVEAAKILRSNTK